MNAEEKNGNMLELNKIYQGDCLEIMPNIDNHSVNLIVCDLPYGVTQNKADIIISLDKLWKEYKRIIKNNGTIVLTSQFPFTIELINSNRGWFKYDLIWDKKLPSGFLNARKMPLRVHEHILVFYNKLGTYNPQFKRGQPSHSKGSIKTDVNRNYGKYGKVDNSKLQGTDKFPISILSLQKPHPSKALHRTEKPIELAEWLIKTYSNKGDLILDNCIGIGWTAVASRRTERDFIGIEKDKKFVDIANKRLQQQTLHSLNQK